MLHATRTIAHDSPTLAAFDDMRLARLVQYLRGREPDDQIGYSILVYRLTDDQVRDAVY
jgi:hypothetical protein